MPLNFTLTGSNNVSLSNNNLTITSTGVDPGAKTTIPVSGKCAFAFRYSVAADTGQQVSGFMGPAYSFTSYSGGAIVAMQEYGDVQIGAANAAGTNLGAQSFPGVDFLANDIAYWVVDFDANKVWFYKNNVQLTTGDPAAGTGGLSGYISGTGLVPFASPYTNGSSITIIDDPVAAGLTVPAGFTWLGASATAAPVNISAPLVTPATDGIVGAVFTTTMGTWDNSPTSYSIQWYRGTAAALGTAIPGAINATYTAVTADAGYVLRALIYATNSIGTSASPAQSTASSAVAIRIVVTATGAYSRQLTTTELPTGYGKVTKVEAWGSGASGARRGRGSGGGAYANSTNTTTGWNVTTDTVLYGSVPAAVAGSSSTSGTNGSAAWARPDNINAAPTVTTMGALAQGGTGGTATVTGAGGVASAGIGNTRYSGGNGGVSGSGTTLRGAGGGGAGAGGAGTAASTVTPGNGGPADAAGYGAGGLGGESTTGTSANPAAAPGGAGGAISGASGSGGTSGQGQIAFWIVPNTPAPVNIAVIPGSVKTQGRVGTAIATTYTDIPTNTTAPSVSTSAVVGVPLTVNPGVWDSAAGYYYQWYKGTAAALGTSISGATNATYTPVAEDAGYVLRCVVTGYNGFGPATTPVQSNATNPVGIYITITTPTDLGSVLFTLSELPAGTGRISNVEAWGPGGGGGNRIRGAGGGAYAGSSNTGAGWPVAVGDLIYYSNPAGGVGKNVDGEAGNSPTGPAWVRAQVNQNTLPNGVANGARAAEGTAGTTTSNGGPGSANSSIGNIKYNGGTGGNIGAGATQRGAGGAGAGSTGSGGGAGGASTGGNPGGTDGSQGGTSFASAGGNGGYAGGGGGSASDVGAYGGNGGDSRVRITYYPDLPAGTTITAVPGTVNTQGRTGNTAFTDNRFVTAVPGTIRTQGRQGTVVAADNKSVVTVPGSIKNRGKVGTVDVSANIAIVAVPGTLKTQGRQGVATKTNHVFITAVSGSVKNRGKIGTVIATAHQYVTAVPGTNRILGKVGTAAATAHQFVTAVAGSIKNRGKVGTVVAQDNKTITAVPGTVKTQGRQGSVLVDQNIRIDVVSGSIKVRGKVGTVTKTDHVTIPAVSGTVKLRGKVGTVIATDHKTVVVVPGTIKARGSIGVVTKTEHVWVYATPGTIRTQGRQGSVVINNHQNVIAVPGSSKLQGRAGEVSKTEHIFVTAQPGNIKLRGKIGTIVAQDNKWVTASAGSVKTRGADGTVQVSDNKYVTAIAGTLSLSGAEGSVFKSEHIYVTAESGSLLSYGSVGSVSVAPRVETSITAIPGRIKVRGSLGTVILSSPGSDSIFKKRRPGIVLSANDIPLNAIEGTVIGTLSLVNVIAPFWSVKIDDDYNGSVKLRGSKLILGKLPTDVPTSMTLSISAKVGPLKISAYHTIHVR